MTSRSTSDSATMVLSPTTPHLVWSASTHSLAGGVDRARLVSASTRLGVVSPAWASMPCTPRNSRSTCSMRSAPTATGPDQRVRRRAHAAGQHDRLARGARLVQQLRHRDRVRHHREVRDVAHRAGELVGRGAGRDADRGARARPAGPRPAAMACFCGVIRADFAVNPGSSALRPPTASAPPCTRSTRPSRGELLDVAADRHVGDAELLDEVGDPHGAGRPRRGRGWSRGAGWRAWPQPPAPRRRRREREYRRGRSRRSVTRSWPVTSTRCSTSVSLTRKSQLPSVPRRRTTSTPAGHAGGRAAPRPPRRPRRAAWRGRRRRAGC